MEIVEDEELRQLIQKIIDEDKRQPKEEPRVTMSNLVGPSPSKVLYYDPTIERRLEP